MNKNVEHEKNEAENKLDNFEPKFEHRCRDKEIAIRIEWLFVHMVQMTKYLDVLNVVE